VPAGGIWRNYAFARVEGFPVYVGRGMSQAAVERRWYSNLVTYVAFFVSSVLVLLALGLFAWRQHRIVLTNAANLEVLVAERTKHLNRALEEKTAFFREVHHRVKNNLQIISSLVRLQESHGEGPRNIEHRIQAMALVHELLYSRAEATNLDLADYIPRLCTALEATAERGATCTVDAIPALIDLERAVPFALILSEVVTNAFKHARPPIERLEVKVSLARDGKDLVLDVSDNGDAGPAPDGSGKGFGLKLIRALTVQLDGTSGFRNDGGTSFTLRFPARRAAEPAERA
jgi:two-component sensor histidine kinase